MVTLYGHDRRIEWDVKVGPFLSGATVTRKSTPPVEFSASFYLVKDPGRAVDDFAAWDEFVRTIKSTVQGPKPKALPIYHPDLAANDIAAVVMAEIGGMQYDGLGGATIVVKFQEYFPPRLQGGTPKGASEGDPNAPLKATVNALTLQYQATAWG